MAYKIKPLEFRKCYATECTRARAPGKSYCRICEPRRRNELKKAARKAAKAN